MWILFNVPCPTPDGRSAKDLYERRLTWISPEMTLRGMCVRSRDAFEARVSW